MKRYILIVSRKLPLNFRKAFSRGVCYTIQIQMYKLLLNTQHHEKLPFKFIFTFIKFTGNKLKFKKSLFLIEILKGQHKSYSQIGQDLFVLFTLNRKRNGFFVEIGAGDGVHLSNTYLLENEFGWTGILVEPNKSFYSECCRNRTSLVKNNLILNRSGSKIKFYEKELGEFSHADGFGDSSASYVIDSYEVQTIEFNNLFNELNPPIVIDFLSIDTEGSEFEILRSVDFNKFKPKIICIEHNFNKKRRKSYKRLLTQYGYELMYPGISRWDSWFVLK